MTESSKRYLGLDVHEDSIDIAIAVAGADSELRHFGTIPGDLAHLDKALQRLWDGAGQRSENPRLAL